MPVRCADGLVEVRGTDLPDSVTALAARPADAGGLDTEALADVLVGDVPNRAPRRRRGGAADAVDRRAELPRAGDARR
ncbi:hypothetical protein [Streptomyces werraensis]|uniref:hypothetical protein n=1 Tax=Streptomyces werraensis TaxID=68284 RepID=UPI0036AFB989